MPNGHTLELSTIPTRHPKIGQGLLHMYGPSAIVRLSRDPSSLPSGIMSRVVVVDWVPRPPDGAPTVIQRSVGWFGLLDSWREVCDVLHRTINEQELTEKAAIGVMAVLISDLEGGQLETVLPIGSGGDYHVVVRRLHKPAQVECSGIREDGDGADSRNRLNKRWGQVLTKDKRGFVSVTTFSYPPGAVVHSYLHFVAKRRHRRKRARR